MHVADPRWRVSHDEGSGDLCFELEHGAEGGDELELGGEDFGRVRDSNQVLWVGGPQCEFVGLCEAAGFFEVDGGPGRGQAVSGLSALRRHQGERLEPVFVDEPVFLAHHDIHGARHVWLVAVGGFADASHELP